MAVRRAREAVEALCRSTGVEEDVRDVATLLTSEVVTNSILHGRSRAWLGAWVAPTSLHVAVVDESPLHPVRAARGDTAADGRGIAIVELLAARWGVEDLSPGKVVWFNLSRTAG